MMLAAFGKWLITSRWGQTLVLALAITLTFWVAHWYISDKAYDAGYTACQTEHAKAVADANLQQSKQEQEQRENASEIEQSTDAAVQEAVTTINNETSETKEIVRYVYRDPPTPTAAACLPQPLDPRVQDRIDRAVDSSNRS